MDALSAILVAAAGLIGVIAATGGYLLNRLRQLEEDTDNKRRADMQQLSDENVRLMRRLADAEEKLRRMPELEMQVSTLTRTTADLQKRLEAALERLDDRERELARLGEENSALRDALRAKTEECAQLHIKVEAYENALRLIGSERAKSETEKAVAEKAGGQEKETDDGVESEHA